LPLLLGTAVVLVGCGTQVSTRSGASLARTSSTVATSQRQGVRGHGVSVSLPKGWVEIPNVGPAMNTAEVLAVATRVLPRRRFPYCARVAEPALEVMSPTDAIVVVQWSPRFSSPIDGRPFRLGPRPADPAAVIQFRPFQSCEQHRDLVLGELGFDHGARPVGISVVLGQQATDLVRQQALTIVANLRFD
jgi:hypothetical protein